MAIKRVEVFARRYGARIISITNEQAELIEHSTQEEMRMRGEGENLSPHLSFPLFPWLGL